MNNVQMHDKKIEHYFFFAIFLHQKLLRVAHLGGISGRISWKRQREARKRRLSIRFPMSGEHARELFSLSLSLSSILRDRCLVKKKKKNALEINIVPRPRVRSEDSSSMQFAKQVTRYTQ